MDKYFNDELHENTKDIIGERLKNGASDKDRLDIAMKVEMEVSDIFMKYNLTVDEAFMICLAMAQTMYLYGMFGDTYDDV